ncbi:MAG: hypothetical protein ACRD5B_15295 [Nitrososphaeraceae archaeon]
MTKDFEYEMTICNRCGNDQSVIPGIMDVQTESFTNPVTGEEDREKQTPFNKQVSENLSRKGVRRKFDKYQRASVEA